MPEPFAEPDSDYETWVSKFGAAMRKLRKLQLEAVKADNAVLRQHVSIFRPVEERIKNLVNSHAIENDESPFKSLGDQMIMEAIRKTGSVVGAAAMLKIGRSTIYKRLRGKLDGLRLDEKETDEALAYEPPPTSGNGRTSVFDYIDEQNKKHHTAQPEAV